MTSRVIYTEEPTPVAVYPLRKQEVTDIYIRQNIEPTTVEDGEEEQQAWVCDETYFRYGQIVSQADVEADVSLFLSYAEEQSRRGLDEAIDAKVAELSQVCEATIISGFDVRLSDGHVHHFSLSAYDQPKIAALAQKAAETGQAQPWHADGELCVFFPVEDILSINTQMEATITYQTTYFNSLKNYVKQLGSVAEVEAVRYGQAFPKDYWSEVLKALVDQ